jgi:4-amino-4-deoxy-L-arabinose transferase-like glycosyltransferase
MYRTLLILLPLTLVALLAGSFFAHPDTTIDMSDPESARYLVGFNAVETNAHDTYRWSLGGVPALFLYGFESWPVLLDLRLSSARPPSAHPAETTIASGGRSLGRFRLDDQWRHYHLLLPPQPSSERAIVFTPVTFVPGDGDSRALGFALSSFNVSVPHQGGWYLPGRVRLAYLLLLPLLVFVLVAHLSPRGALPAALSAVVAVTLAAAFPWQAGYWFPTMWSLYACLAGLALLLMLKASFVSRKGGGMVQAVRHRVAESHLVSRFSRTSAIMLSTGAALAGLLLMRLSPAPLNGWVLASGLLLAGGGTLVALALMPAWEAADAADDAPVTRSEVATLAAITLVAGGLRLWQLDSLPMGLWRDEARHGLVALRILNEPDYRPVYVPHKAGLPALFFYLIAPVIGIFGPHVWTLRLIPALVGTLLPLALWWCFRPLVGQRVALVAAWLIAIASWSVSLSRWGYPVTLDLFFVLLSVGCMWRALPHQPATRATLLRSVGLMMASALLAGLGMYTYYTGRMAPLSIGLMTLVRLGPSPARWRQYAPALVAALVVGVLTISPLFVYMVENPASYNRRVAGVGFWNDSSREMHAPVRLFLHNAVRQVGIWHVQGDNNGRYHTPDIPVLDPVTGVTMLVGLGVAWRSTRWASARWVLLVWLGVALLPGLLSAGAPHTVRSSGTMVPAFVAAAVGIVALVDILRHHLARLVFAVLVVLFLNTGVYFGAMPHDPRVYREFYITETHMGQIAREVARTTDPSLQQIAVFFSDGALESDVGQFMASGLPVGAYDDEERFLEHQPGTPALLLLPGDISPSKHQDALDLLGPGAVELAGEPCYPDGQPTLHAFAVGKQAVQWWDGRYEQ